MLQLCFARMFNLLDYIFGWIPLTVVCKISHLHNYSFLSYFCHLYIFCLFARKCLFYLMGKSCVGAIVPLVEHDWLKWARGKYDTQRLGL